VIAICGLGTWSDQPAAQGDLPPSVIGQKARDDSSPSLGARPGALDLLRMWVPVGVQSFGGGQAVQLYAYHALVESRKWLTPQEYARDWGICQLVPGVNLIALPMLVGYRLAGVPGSIASLVGLMAPSITITIAIAASYLRLREVAHVQAAVHGMLMAAAGGSLLVAVRLMLPMLRQSKSEGRPAVVAALAMVAVCGLLVFTGRAPVYALVLGSGVAMAAVFVISATHSRGTVGQ
jgi:chromate transporter